MKNQNTCKHKNSWPALSGARWFQCHDCMGQIGGEPPWYSISNGKWWHRILKKLVGSV
jgi:hypothetical protein